MFYGSAYCKDGLDAGSLAISVNNKDMIDLFIKTGVDVHFKNKVSRSHGQLHT